MTGFGRGEAEGEGWKVSVMIRSLNGKGLDISIKAPIFLMPLEQEVKRLVKEKLRRGTVLVFIDVEPKRAEPPVDPERLARNVSFLKHLSRERLSLNTSDDLLFELAWKYAERPPGEVDEELKETVLASTDKALGDLVESRKREGLTLLEDLSNRVKRIEDMLGRILEIKDDLMTAVKDKVLERAKQLDLPKEHPTVLNEIAFLIERMDIEEELTRLRAHLRRFKELLGKEEVGKKLEFLAQEMHREVTTLGNKLPYLSRFVVDIKAEIDRIKQQAANVE